jgi:hypothetical protein
MFMPVAESTTRLCFGSASTGIGHKWLPDSKETLREGGDGEDWQKISHIPNIYFDDILL